MAAMWCQAGLELSARSRSSRPSAIGPSIELPGAQYSSESDAVGRAEKQQVEFYGSVILAHQALDFINETECGRGVKIGWAAKNSNSKRPPPTLDRL